MAITVLTSSQMYEYQLVKTSGNWSHGEVKNYVLGVVHSGLSNLL